MQWPFHRDMNFPLRNYSSISLYQDLGIIKHVRNAGTLQEYRKNERMQEFHEEVSNELGKKVNPFISQLGNIKEDAEELLRPKINWKTQQYGVETVNEGCTDKRKGKLRLRMGLQNLGQTKQAWIVVILFIFRS